VVDPAPSSAPALRVIAAADGGLAAVIDGAALAVIDLESGAQLTRLALPHVDAEVAWLGAPPRLLVLERDSGFQTARIYDPHTLEPGGEVRIEASMRLLASNGPYALFAGARGASVLQAGAMQLRQYQFPTRTLPGVAGAAARQFVVAQPGAIEEWDPEHRVPRRRLRLPRPAAIHALGGTERSVWFAMQDAPARVEVIALVNRGQPLAHELPEPLGAIAAHPRRDLLAAIGRDSGRVYVIDLDGRAPARAIEGVDQVDGVQLFVGRALGLVAIRGDEVLRFGADGRQLAGPASARSAARAPAEPALVAPLIVAPEPEAAPEPASAPEPEPEPAAQPELALPPRAPDDSAYPPAALPVPRAAPRAHGRELAGLAPRSATRRCPAGQYQTLLEHYRRSIIATVANAIARDWDSGRLVFPRQDEPAFLSEVLALANRQRGLATTRLVEAAEAYESTSAALAAAKITLDGKLTPLDELRIDHQLSASAELVLLYLTAPFIWGEIARLHGILANDPMRSVVDEHLLWQLLGDTVSRSEIAHELDPASPLMRHGLVRSSGERARPFQALVPDPAVVKLVSGRDTAGDEPGLELVRPRVPLDRVLAPARVIERACAELAEAPPGTARVVVRGRTGSGRRTLLAALGGLAGRPLAMLDAAMLIRERRIPALATMLQRATLCGWLPCIDGLDAIPSDDPATRAAVRAIVNEHRGPVALRLAPHTQPPLEPPYVAIDLPTSTIAERAEQWTGALASRGLVAEDPDSLAARYTIGPGTIQRVAASVEHRAGALDVAIDDAMRQHLDTKIGAVATRITKLASWSQIVLPADIRDSIVELIARVRHRRRVYDTWGFDRVMTSSRGLTALFQGGPGTGKTLVAGAIASELGLDLYRVDLSRVTSKWIGETEQNLAKVFDAAEEGQILVLFDEADSLFTKRTEVRTSVDRYANLEVNYLLQRLDTFEGVAILTTNFGSAIDPAFKRRLAVRLTFPFPDEEARERLWNVHLPPEVPRAGKLDLAGLARRYRMSGGYIRNAALRAAFLAAEEDSPLTQDHLERAVRAEFREVGKLAESGVLE
jgi:ATPase family protein associated with various cellular activities (AAA)